MKKILIKLIELYQRVPFGIHSSCKFVPTCSSYTKESIERFGVIKGGYLGIKRILRCNPFNIGGYDPVKEKYEKN